VITQLSLQNIRLFDDDFWQFDLAPLTVLCGTNSSGKSTLLKTLLLLRQSTDFRESLGSPDGELRLVGSYVDMGSYTSLVSHRETDRLMGIRLGVTGLMPRDAVSDLRRFNGESVDSRRRDKGRTRYDFIAEFLFAPRDPPQPDEEALDADVTKPERAEQDVALHTQLRRADFGLVVDGRGLLSWFIEQNRSHSGYDLYVPIKVFREFRRQLRVKGVKPPKVRTRRGQQYAVVHTQLIGLLPLRMIVPLKSDPSQIEQVHEPDSITTPLPPYLAEPVRKLLSAIETVHYLAPLRTPAKRYYVLDAGRSVMDSAGEYLPYILRDSSTRLVSHVPPSGGKRIRSTLGDALNEWLSYLRTGEFGYRQQDNELNVLPTKHVFVELSIRSAFGDELHALADSGVGYSQVLPILAQCLLAGVGSTTAIEQPELHLNPAVQVRLATFFARMAQAGKQVILETHSEHIVNAIRVLAAEDASGDLASDTRVYFVDTRGREIHVRDMAIGPDGSVDDWPEGFFGEALGLTGRLLRAQRLHRKSAAPKEG